MEVMKQKHDLTKTSRLVGIHARLQDVSKRRWGVSRKELSDLIGADKRTVFRYIAELRGAPRYLPIVHDANRGGYHYSQEVPYFPIGSGLTYQELIALEVAQQALSVFEGVGFAEKIRSAFEKVTGVAMGIKSLGLGIPIAALISFRTPGAGTANAKVFSAILDALLDHRVIEIDYKSSSNGFVEKRLKIQPLHIACVSGRWILIAQDKTPTIRPYIIPRFSNPIPTNITFKYPADFCPQNHVASSFDVRRSPLGQKPMLVKMIISKRSVHHVLERSWHPTQRVVTLPTGDIELSFNVSNTDAIKHWILGFGSACEVIAPVALRQELTEEAKEMVALNEKAKFA